MKKFTLIMFAVMLAICCIALTACDFLKKDQPQDVLELKNLKTEYAFGEEFSFVGQVFFNGEQKSVFVVERGNYNKDVAGNYTITIRYGTTEQSYTVTVAEQPVPDVHPVAISVQGATAEFFTNGDFVFDGEVYLEISDGTRSKLSQSDGYVVDSSAFNSAVAGSYTIKVTYGGWETSYNVLVSKPYPTGLVVENATTEYSFGQSFAFDGDVYLVFNDGSRTQLDVNDCNISKGKFDSTRNGSYTITVKYATYQATYQATVTLSTTVTALTVENLQTEYAFGQAFDNDFDVYLTYDDGHKVKLSADKYVVNNSRFNKNVAGNYTVTIVAKDGSGNTSITVTVNKSTVVSAVELTDYTTEMLTQRDYAYDGKVFATYTDGRREQIQPANYTVDTSNFVKTAEGTYTIIVTVGGVSANLSVQTFDVMQNGLTVSNYVNTCNYGENYTLDTCTVKRTFTNGSTQDINLSDCTIDYQGFNSYTAGKQYISVIDGEFVAQAQVEVTNLVPQNKINLLIIGNSYSVDTIIYMRKIAQSMGFADKDVNIGALYHGGCSIEQHWQSRGVKFYFFYNYDVNFRSDADSKTETVDPYDTSLEDGVTAYAWDYICFQQYSKLSGKSDSYSDLANLINYVKSIATNPNVKFLFNMTWAYQQGYGELSDSYNNSQIKMYNDICATVKSCVVPQKDILMVCPIGTAVQNLRTSYFGDTLNRDGTHISRPVGSYLCGLTMFCQVTGYKPQDVKWYNSGIDKIDKMAIDEAISNAFANKFQVTPSQYPTKDLSVMLNGMTQMDNSAMGWQTGYWNAAVDNPNRFITGTDNFTRKFAATKQFTKDDIPVGSVIVVTDNFQYRPEGWVNTDTKVSNRPGNVTAQYYVVDEAFWSEFNVRAFNVSCITADTIITVQDAQQHFQIWLPNN